MRLGIAVLLLGFLVGCVSPQAKKSVFKGHYEEGDCYGAFITTGDHHLYFLSDYPKALGDFLVKQPVYHEKRVDWFVAVYLEVVGTVSYDKFDNVDELHIVQILKMAPANPEYIAIACEPRIQAEAPPKDNAFSSDFLI